MVITWKICGMSVCVYLLRCCPTLNNYMNFSDTEGIYTHTFEAERNVRLTLTTQLCGPSRFSRIAILPTVCDFNN